jgi:hypothetical protein
MANKIKKEDKITDYMDFTYWDMPVEDRLKIDVGDIYDNKIQCTKCKKIIRSKNRHHFVRCRCGAVAIDGGSWYQRILGNREDFIDRSKLFKHKHKK